jgi:hypothetical protein
MRVCVCFFWVGVLRQAELLYSVAAAGKAADVERLLAEGVPPDAHRDPKVKSASLEATELRNE